MLLICIDFNPYFVLFDEDMQWQMQILMKQRKFGLTFLFFICLNIFLDNTLTKVISHGDFGNNVVYFVSIKY